MGKTLEAGKSVRLPYFGDDPWFCNTFGLRAEIYVTKGAPGKHHVHAYVHRGVFFGGAAQLVGFQRETKGHVVGSPLQAGDGRAHVGVVFSHHSLVYPTRGGWALSPRLIVFCIEILVPYLEDVASRLT